MSIRHVYATAASLTSSNPTLGAGEIGLESDTGLAKIGDGSTAWTSLKYWRPNKHEWWAFTDIDFDEDNATPNRDTPPSAALGNLSCWEIADSVSTALSGGLRPVPPGWNTADLHAVFITVNSTAGANLRISAQAQKLSAAFAFVGTGPGATNYAINGGASGTMTDVTLASGLSVPSDGWWGPRAFMARTDAGDTFSGNIGLVGMYFQRAS